MFDYVNFDVKQFSSGEYSVKIVDRINHFNAYILWNWFEDKSFDLLLLKIDAVKVNYPQVNIIVFIPYMPYSRQDRIFEVGQGIPIGVISKALDAVGCKVYTFAFHTKNYINCIYGNIKHSLTEEKGIMYVFPDASAKNHYSVNMFGYFNFAEIFKTRLSDGSIVIDMEKSKHGLNNIKDCKDNHTVLICDDIIAGGRTFIEVAKLIKEMNPLVKIEVLVYNAFLDYGLDKIKESGISKINIINRCSYDYVNKLYPDESEFFTLQRLEY